MRHRIAWLHANDLKNRTFSWRQAAALQVLSCLADLSGLPAHPLLLTMTGRLLSAQLKQMKSGGCIQMKVDDDSLREHASFRTVAVLFLHSVDR